MMCLRIALDVEQRVSVPESDVTRLTARDLLCLTVTHEQDASQVVRRVGALETRLTLLTVRTLATLATRGARVRASGVAGNG